LAIAVSLVLVIIIAVTLSFTLLKKNTDNLIKAQRDKLLTIINVPNAVPPSNPTFNSVTYTWEMETMQKEVTGVNILQTTGLERADEKIIVVLEKSAGGDASIFDKVLPAVIKDTQVLNAAYSPEKITHLENGKTGFKSVTIQRDNSDKIAKITWEFNKKEFGENADAYYDKINSMPESAIKILYNIQNIIISAFSA